MASSIGTSASGSGATASSSGAPTSGTPASDAPASGAATAAAATMPPAEGTKAWFDEIASLFERATSGDDDSRVQALTVFFERFGVKRGTNADMGPSLDAIELEMESDYPGTIFGGSIELGMHIIDAAATAYNQGKPARAIEILIQQSRDAPVSGDTMRKYMPPMFPPPLPSEPPLPSSTFKAASDANLEGVSGVEDQHIMEALNEYLIGSTAAGLAGPTWDLIKRYYSSIATDTARTAVFFTFFKQICDNRLPKGVRDLLTQLQGKAIPSTRPDGSIKLRPICIAEPLLAVASRAMILAHRARIRESQNSPGRSRTTASGHQAARK